MILNYIKVSSQLDKTELNWCNFLEPYSSQNIVYLLRFFSEKLWWQQTRRSVQYFLFLTTDSSFTCEPDIPRFTVGLDISIRVSIQWDVPEIALVKGILEGPPELAPHDLEDQQLNCGAFWTVKLPTQLWVLTSCIFFRLYFTTCGHVEVSL